MWPPVKCRPPAFSCPTRVPRSYTVGRPFYECLVVSHIKRKHTLRTIIRGQSPISDQIKPPPARVRDARCTVWRRVLSLNKRVLKHDHVVAPGAASNETLFPFRPVESGKRTDLSDCSSFWVFLCPTVDPSTTYQNSLPFAILLIASPSEQSVGRHQCGVFICHLPNNGLDPGKLFRFRGLREPIFNLR